MSDVPKEVQDLHMRLFEEYVEALLAHVRVNQWPVAKDVADRIERVLSLQTVVVNISLDQRDYEALTTFRDIMRDWLADESKPEPESLTRLDGVIARMEGTPADEPEPTDPVGPVEAEGVLPDVPPLKGHGDEREPDAGMADDSDVGVSELQPSGSVGASAPGADDEPEVIGPEIRHAKMRGFSDADIDAIWETRPDLTRSQVASQLRRGLLKVREVAV